MNLKVIHNGIDLSLGMASFTNPVKDLDLSSEAIYLGFHKPINSIYIEMSDREDAAELSLQYWNGSEYSDLEIKDHTEGLTCSGLISWSNEDLDIEETTHLTFGEMYWLKLSVDTNPASVSINGINLVLSNDKDLSFIPNLDQYLPSGVTSFIGFHQEARDLIVQGVRNSGKRIYRHVNIDPRQVDQFDLLNIEEFKNASKYLALHLIFDYLSKSDEDSYRQKSDRYYERYLGCLNTNLITIDTNDNGEADEAENMAVQFIRIRRE